MTDLTPLRDRLAVLCGFRKIEPQVDGGKVMWERGGVILIDCHAGEPSHPFPPNDLTALAAAWPDDAEVDVLYRVGRGWCVVEYPRVEDWAIMAQWYPTRYEAELRWLVARMTVAVMEAMAKGGG